MAVITRSPKPALPRRALAAALVAAIALGAVLSHTGPSRPEPPAPSPPASPRLPAVATTPAAWPTGPLERAPVRRPASAPPPPPHAPQPTPAREAPEAFDEDRLRAALADPQRATAALDALLHPGEAPPDATVAAALARTQPALWASRLGELLRTSDLASRQLALTLLDAGGTTSPQVQALARQAVDSDSDPVALVHALGVLQRALPADTDPSEGIALARSLQGLGLAAEPLVRRESLRALAHLGEPAPLIEGANRALDDADARVRRAALDALRDLPLPPEVAARVAAADASTDAGPDSVEAPEQVDRMTLP